MASREYYLRTVRNQITTTTIQDSIVKELFSHIEDQKEAYIADGLSEEAAEEAAVEEMGDPVEVGAALNEIHMPRPVKKYVICMMLVTFTMVGINLYSILTRRYSPGDDLYYRSITWGDYSSNLAAALGFLFIMGIILAFYFYIACGKNLRLTEQRRPFGMIEGICVGVGTQILISFLKKLQGRTIWEDPDYLTITILYFMFTIIFGLLNNMICTRKQKHGCINNFIRGAVFLTVIIWLNKDSFLMTVEVSTVYAAAFTFACRRNWYPQKRSFFSKKIIPYLFWILPIFCIGCIVSKIAAGEIRLPLTIPAPQFTWEMSYLFDFCKKFGIFPAYGILAVGMAIEVFLIRQFLHNKSEYGRIFFLVLSLTLAFLLLNGVLALYGFLPESYLFTPFLWKLNKGTLNNLFPDFYQLSFYYTMVGYITRFTSRENILDLELSPLPPKSRRKSWFDRKPAA